MTKNMVIEIIVVVVGVLRVKQHQELQLVQLQNNYLNQYLLQRIPLL
jgi:hypothetical protein